jgi:hypothetical protein
MQTVLQSAISLITQKSFTTNGTTGYLTKQGLEPPQQFEIVWFELLHCVEHSQVETK